MTNLSHMMPDPFGATLEEDGCPQRVVLDTLQLMFENFMAASPGGALEQAAETLFEYVHALGKVYYCYHQNAPLIERGGLLYNRIYHYPVIILDEIFKEGIAAARKNVAEQLVVQAANRSGIVI